MKSNSSKDHGRKNKFRDEAAEPMPFKKKAFGQHFLRKQSVVDHMIDKVIITPEVSVLEIGCGDGFLTKSILDQTKCKQLLIYEIDPEWAGVVERKINDSRMKILMQDVLRADFGELEKDKPWVVLANLPYQITFPILFLFQKNKHLFNEGVVMVQEEVAQKVVSTSGKKYTHVSMFLQYHFELKLMEKVEPGAFIPPPKIYSRLIYFKPRFDLEPIFDEENFWKFIKMCFRSSRQTLRNNLKTTHYDLAKISHETLQLRGQQLLFKDFLDIWNKLNDR